MTNNRFSGTRRGRRWDTHCDPFVSGPALAIERTPGPVCLTAGSTHGSGRFSGAATHKQVCLSLAIPQ
jgi:hypothetical protein